MLDGVTILMVLSFLLIVYYKISILETHQRKAANYFPAGKPMPLVSSIAIFMPTRKIDA